MMGISPLFVFVSPLALTPVTEAGGTVLSLLRAWPGDHQVAVGLSGGVDSSLAAALLVAAGWQVEGLTLWLMSGKGACCAEGLVDATAICDQLGIVHHVVDARDTFRAEIVDFLVEGYQAGVTPLPCSRCNRQVKFGPMLEWAQRERGLPRLATGHYARLRHGQQSGERHQLLRGLDRHKDQSYFLYDLPQEVLARLVFPLGEMGKPETRAEATALGLRTAQKPESMDLCLADHHGSMRAFLDAYLPPRQGQIVLADGTVIGEHDGIEHFTIGQRRGLGIAWSEPLHVIGLESSANRVVVAPRAQASRQDCGVGAVNWVSIDPPLAPLRVQVQLRYRSEPVAALLTPVSCQESDRQAERPYRCRLDFDADQFSITPGQAAVFYEQDTLLGGGLIHL